MAVSLVVVNRGVGANCDMSAGEDRKEGAVMRSVIATRELTCGVRRLGVMRIGLMADDDGGAALTALANSIAEDGVAGGCANETGVIGIACLLATSTDRGTTICGA